jgi:hypothetical protein
MNWFIWGSLQKKLYVVSMYDHFSCMVVLDHSKDSSKITTSFSSLTTS